MGCFESTVKSHGSDIKAHICTISVNAEFKSPIFYIIFDDSYLEIKWIFNAGGVPGERIYMHDIG